jgi:hypothetical protein
MHTAYKFDSVPTGQTEYFSPVWMIGGFAAAPSLDIRTFSFRRKRNLKRKISWQCALIGRTPEWVWRNTESFVFAFSSCKLSWPPQVRASDLCRDRLVDVVRTAERFAPSYNKFLIQGAADYCSRVLSRLNEVREPEKSLLNRIRRFASQVEALCSQYADQYAASFPLLDLQVIEDRFELIQGESARLGVLPLLRNIPTAELVDR